MKTKMLLLVLLILKMSSLNILFSQNLDSCYCKPESDSTIEYDLIIDSCNIMLRDTDCTNLFVNNYHYHIDETTKRIFTKKCLHIWFDKEVLKIPVAPPDTIIEVDWSEIDTIFTEIREGFKELENQFGYFKLRKIYPDIVFIPEGQMFYIIFNDYVSLISTVTKLNTIPYIKFTIGCLPSFMDVRYKINRNIIDFNVYPIPASDNIRIDFNSNNYFRTNIVIYNLLGIKQKEIEYELISGENSITFDVGDLSSGVYFVVVNDGKEIRKQMFIKE